MRCTEFCESDAVNFTGNPDSDEDRDGLSALLEYALGTSDNDPQDAAQSFLVVAGEAGDLLLEFPRNAGAEDVIVSIEKSGKASPSL